MSLFDSSLPAVTVLVDVPFPATIVSGPGIAINTLDPTAWEIELDYAPLPEDTTLTPPSNYYLAVLNEATGNYEKIRFDNATNQISNIDQRSPVGDTDYAVNINDRYVGLTAPLTAPRSINLPPASTTHPGHALTVQDEVGGLSSAHFWTVAANGSDTIDGWPSRTLSRPHAGLTLWSDGALRWSLVAVTGMAEPTSNYVIQPDDTSVGFGTLTSPVTATLPPAHSVQPGKQITVLDLLGSCSATNKITVTPAAGDLINGVPSPLTAALQAPYAYITLQTDSVSHWTVVAGGTAASINTILSTQISDSTAVGRAVLTAPTAGAAQTAIGATAVGAAVFTAANAAAAQAALGAGTTGAAVFVAATPAAAQSALGLGDMATQASSNVNITGGSIASTQLNNDIMVGGSIDNTPIGASTPTAGHFTTMSATGANITGGTISSGVTIAGMPAPSTANPTMAGTAAPGTATTYSRGDHVHPTDTSRAAASALANYLPLTGGTVTGNLTVNGVLQAGNAYINYSGYALYSNGPIWTAGALTMAGAAISSNNGIYVNGAGSNQANVSTSNGGTSAGWSGALGCWATASGVGYAGLARSDSTSAYLWYFTAGGSNIGSIYTNGSTTTYNTTSDRSVKDNIRDLISDIDVGALIDAIRPVAFEWKRPAAAFDVVPETAPRSNIGHGFVAQDLYEVVPLAVTPALPIGPGKRHPDDGPHLWGVDFSKLVPYLVAEIQNLRRRIAALEGG